MRILRDQCGAPCGLPASRLMLELGAVLMRTETELILKSRRVVPARLLEAGFRFAYPHWEDAARELCERWHAQVVAPVPPDRVAGRGRRAVSQSDKVSPSRSRGGNT